MGSSRLRTLALIAADSIFIVGSIAVSYFLRFGSSLGQYYIEQGCLYAAISLIAGIFFMFYFRLYRRVWQYASIGEIISIVKAVTLACACSYIVSSFIIEGRVPISIFLLTYETILITLGGSRFIWRVYRDGYSKKKSNLRQALIIGAGDCGVLVLKELKFNSTSSMYPVGFIDDDPHKQRQQVNGLPVLGGRGRILEIVKQMKIDDIIIAMPSASKSEISEIIDICKQTKAKLKMIPQINDVIQGKVSLNVMRDVDVEDLLGRDPVELELDGIADYLHGKVVLVTGAGGSIGSELCRQISQFEPAKLLLLGHGENSIYQINKELSRTYPLLSKEAIIADVQDRERLEQVFAGHRPQVVFHAAAHKHVPLMEINPGEAIKNNVFGTKNVAECADMYEAERFVLISTDKAVNPTSIMGTTKRIAEMFIQSLDKQSKTIFAAVRFGNVLGSRGSVIPLFKEQIAAGGPVTVTHPEMVRYFMTIPEASKLVIQAGAFSEGGEVFVLDMGEPVNIADLARDLIRLSGYEPNVDIRIEFTGIRQGEKLYEELLTSEEGIARTKHDRIFIGQPSGFSKEDMELELKRLEKVIGEDLGLIRKKLFRIVPTYQTEYEYV